jgi:hypothetical protein
MNFNLKTLIVFDTNSIRDTDSGSVVYKNFSFGGTFKNIDEFISKNKLYEFVKLATSQIAIEELKNQKRQSYESDTGKLKELSKRLEGLPHIPDGKLSIALDSFDCESHIKTESEKFISGKNILLLDIKEEKAPTVLKSMMDRVLRKEKSPFSDSGKFKDAGFKDNIVWESLLHYENLTEYDKVVFITADNDFKPNCIEEFKLKWNKHIKFLKTPSEIEAELKSDYGNYIEFSKFYEHTETEYFKGYLDDILTVISVIQLPEGEFPIENSRIINLCSKVERVPDPEGDFESIQIHTTVEIDTTINGDKMKIPVEIITKFSDEENKEIEDYTSKPNLS